uniref:Uncharacterized protein n=1 Tax=Mononegavirales sp. TaxID=1955139 RepID=A0A8B0RJ42_9MONO|nr:hypothetical protein [Mononegavirales sp.]
MRYFTIAILLLVIVAAHVVAMRSLTYKLNEKVPMIAIINDHAAWFMRITVDPATINYYATIVSLASTSILMGVLAWNWRAYVQDIRRGVVRAEVLMRSA